LGPRFSELDLSDPEFIPGRPEVCAPFATQVILKFADLPIFEGVHMFLRHIIKKRKCEL